MKNEQLVRDYNFTDSELTVFTQHLCDCMTRDVSSFADYGVTATEIASLESLNNAFEIFPTDDYIYQEYLSAIEERDNLWEALRVVIRSMALRVELQWGKHSPKYRSLGIAEMSRVSVESYITLARMVYAFVEEHKTILADEGLTQQMLDNMAELIELFDDSIRLTIEKLSYRAEKTTQRINDGNKLYNYVSKYCEMGKRIWDRVNPSFFADYVLYDTSHGGLPRPVNFRFVQENSGFAWNVVPHASSYQAELSYDQENWEEVYTGTDTSFHADPMQPFTYWRVRAKNYNGYGQFSDVLEVEYYRILPTPTDFNLEWDPEVPSNILLTASPVRTATFYSIFSSVVAKGAPAGSYGIISEVPSPRYSGELTPNRRHYFKMRAENNTQTSGQTPPLYMDVD